MNLLATGDRDAFDHHVVALYRDDTLASRLTDAGAAVSVLGGRGPRDAPSLLLRLSSAIKGANPDLVHTQLVTSDLLGRAAVLLSARRPVLSTLQNRPYDPVAIGTEFPTAFLSAAIRRTDRWLGVRTKTRYIAVSESVRSSYIRELGIAPERIEVVYNSVDLSRFHKKEASPAERRARRAVLGLRDAPLLLNVARHTHQKGLLNLVAAMDSSLLRATRAHLLLVGTGPDTSSIRQNIGARKLDSVISLLGRRLDVRELMELCDVFVLPSIYEGLPLALLEALAMGLPVVASDLAEIREITTGEGARLVPPGRPELLARAIADLIAAPQTGLGLAREGRLQVERRFDLKKNVLRFEAILREMVLSPPTS